MRVLNQHTSRGTINNREKRLRSSPPDRGIGPGEATEERPTSDKKAAAVSGVVLERVHSLGDLTRDKVGKEGRLAHGTLSTRQRTWQATCKHADIVKIDAPATTPDREDITVECKRAHTVWESDVAHFGDRAARAQVLKLCPALAPCRNDVVLAAHREGYEVWLLRECKALHLAHRAAVKHHQ